MQDERLSSEAVDLQLSDLRTRWRGLQAEGKVGLDCQVEVSRQEHWFVLSGWVDSYSAKCRLIQLVPEREGARWIIDRVRVGRPQPAVGALRSADPARSPTRDDPPLPVS